MGEARRKADAINVAIQVVAEGQAVAKAVAADIASLRAELSKLVSIQEASASASAKARAAAVAQGSAARQAAADARALAQAQKEAADAAAAHRQQLNNLAKGVAAAAVAFAGFQAFRAFVREGLEFNQTIETANLGIASLITAQADLRDAQGHLLTGTAKLGAAQELAADQVNKLRIAGLQTTATTSELVVAFQQAVGVGLRWGLTLDQTRKIAIQMSQAAGALGLPMNQLNEEIRDFLGGNISARNTRIATALGITNEQVREAQKAGKLFDFVTKRLEAFSIAGEATAKTFSGVMSNVREAIQNFAGDATAPLFESLKLTGQKALEEVFDLKNARISENFRGILDVSQEVFGAIGDQLSAAVAGAVEHAKDFSNWLKENKSDVEGVLAAVGLLNDALTSTLADVFGLLIPLGDAGVKAGFFKTVLVGAGVVVAMIHEAFQDLTLVLGVIGNMILIVLIAPFVGFLRIIARAVALFDEDLGQAIDNAASKGDDFLTSNIKGLNEYANQLLNGGFAIDQYVAKVKAMEAELAKTDKTVKKVAPGAPLVTLTSTAGGVKPTSPAKGAAGDTLLAKAELAARLKDLKIMLDQSLISYHDYYAEVVKAQQEAIDKEIAGQQRLLAFTTDTGAKDKIIANIKALNIKRLQVVDDANEAERKSNEKLNDEILKAQIQLLRDSGHLTEARALEVGQKYRKLIADLKANGKEAGAAIVTELFDIETAKVRMEELTRASRVITDQLSLDLAGISAKNKSNAISDQEAITQTTAAYARARAALLLLIPDMERAAAITKDPTQIAAVEQLKQKIDEMGSTIARASDQFIKLKEGARDALQSGLSDFLDQAIEGAKSFHDIWIDVARGVVAQLRKIAAQMISNLIIQKALGLLGSFGGGIAGGAGGGGTQIAGDAAGAVVAASGGYVSGPGSGTSDSIPARLSNGEFVMRADAVRTLGVDFLHSLNRTPVARNRSRGYAEGGLVTAAGGQATGGFDATIGLEEGLVARHIRTKSGTRAILNVIAENRKTISGMIGPGGR